MSTDLMLCNTYSNLEETKSSWTIRKDNIKMDFRGIWHKWVGCCKHGTEPSASTKYEETVAKLLEYTPCN
jgi:hypothetical protein